MIIGTILEIALKLTGLKDQLDQARRERRDRIADYFMQLSKTLKDAHESLSQGMIPHGTCEEMLYHARSLATTVQDEIGEAEAKKLAESMEEAHALEQLLSELHDEGARQQTLADLDRARGMFKALGVSMRGAK